MPKDPSIKKVLLIGSGPIVIGQACEFDYSGTQACKALAQEGVEVVLLNANPATVMTDPERAHRTYVEPLTVEVATEIIRKERPDSLLPTMGGQTALNLAKQLAESGVLAQYGVRLIGASLEAINKAEDRQLFKQAMQRIGAGLPKSFYAHTLDEAMAGIDEVGFPAIVRPSFTLGGLGGGVAQTRAELETIVKAGLAASPTSTVLIEESLIGWKEFELEVVRDKADNVIIVCSIENLDPMGVHTGDSITVAPAQTLTDREYQTMRQWSKAIIREIGVDTGGSNIQFAVHPHSGRVIVIEMNPRVSRSSALASKATGYPIAKVAAKLALGYTLDELTNDITQTSACFEPALDYVVVKIPRFNFDKFPRSAPELTTSMRSVGEVMAIGRTFSEAYGKAMRSLELGRSPLWRPLLPDDPDARLAAVRHHLMVPNPDRPFFLLEAFRVGWSVEDIHALTAIDRFFLGHIGAIVAAADRLAERRTLAQTSDAELREGKRLGLSDVDLAKLLGCDEKTLRAERWRRGIRPSYKCVDTCAAEFEAKTPYLYSTYDVEDEAPPTTRRKVIVLGSGPVRIGQGIEFDYACVHACEALREAGFETIMINCNPETVSTDYDTSDRLYFEPLTLEDVLEVAAREQPLGLVVQLGGQTPLKLAHGLVEAGCKILGTSVDAIDAAEDRGRFAALVEKLGLAAPASGTATSIEEGQRVASSIGYPVMVRPSYVLGGRAMQVAHDARDLAEYLKEAAAVAPEHPVLIDRFLDAAIEVDVDVVADGQGGVRIGGVLEHVEEAGVHSGDAACTLPPYSLSPQLIEELRQQASALARELGVVGLLNVQFAVQFTGQRDKVFILEVNPRASRTVPFVAKATGLPLVRIATRCMVGESLAAQELPAERVLDYVAIKESVFPFARFPGQDVVLGPEMRSTGEVMGLGKTVAAAFKKSQLGAGMLLPTSGTVFVSVKDEDKAQIVDVARRFHRLGFRLIATGGTAHHLVAAGIDVTSVNKVAQGSPHIVDAIAKGGVQLVINTTAGRQAILDSFSLRRAALERNVPIYTTVRAAQMLVASLESAPEPAPDIVSLQQRLGLCAPSLEASR